MNGGLKTGRFPPLDGKALIGTVVACCVVGLFTSQRHAGFGLMFLIPFFVVWIPYSLFLIVWKPARRNTQIAKIILWGVSVSVVIAIHMHRAQEIRARADKVLALILKHKAENGAFPANLADIGWSEAPARSGRTKIFYSNKDGNPMLFYAATFIVFDTYSFDFGEDRWSYVAD